MTREEAAKLLEMAVPLKALTQQEFTRFIQAVNMAIKALETEPHWIPTSERLPTVLEDVILCYYDTVTVGWLQSDGSWMINDGYAQVSADEITAWMPLPEPMRLENK